MKESGNFFDVQSLGFRDIVQNDTKIMVIFVLPS